MPDYKDQLNKLRSEIDTLDNDLAATFNKRLRVVSKIADVKSAGNIGIVDNTREKQVIDNALALANEDNKAEMAGFIRNILALSRLKQRGRLMPSQRPLLPASAAPKTGDVTVAYAGVPGAWGEQAAVDLFTKGSMVNYSEFEDVAEAVSSGKADFGVLPIENSLTGAVGEVYDLLRRYNCFIVGQLWVPIAQCLIGIKGATFHDIREVFSHPQGFSQCRKFLLHKNLELTPCNNTAVGAEMVAEKNDPRYAAIGSRRAAELNGLAVLAPDIGDDQSNKTRFIAIASQPIYDKDCDAVSLTFSTAHISGALCAVLQPFMVRDISLSRIESRPVSADKYRFFADLQANILDEPVKDALLQASAQCEYFEVLGCYNTKRKVN